METGKGLTFVINCDLVPNHDWMSFVSWYSISKVFPDAEVIIAVKRAAPKKDLFKWVVKCGVRLMYYGENFPDFGKKSIEIRPTVAALRNYGIEMGPVSVKSAILANLVDYSDGCGSFVVDEWIDNVKLPFARATVRWAADNMSANEVALLELWQKCGLLYKAL